MSYLIKLKWTTGKTSVIFYYHIVFDCAYLDKISLDKELQAVITLKYLIKLRFYVSYRLQTFVQIPKTCRTVIFMHIDQPNLNIIFVLVPNIGIVF